MSRLSIPLLSASLTFSLCFNATVFAQDSTQMCYDFESHIKNERLSPTKYNPFPSSIDGSLLAARDLEKSDLSTRQISDLLIAAVSPAEGDSPIQLREELFNNLIVASAHRSYSQRPHQSYRILSMAYSMEEATIPLISRVQLYIDTQDADPATLYATISLLAENPVDHIEYEHFINMMNPLSHPYIGLALQDYNYSLSLYRHALKTTGSERDMILISALLDGDKPWAIWAANHLSIEYDIEPMRVKESILEVASRRSFSFKDQHTSIDFSCNTTSLSIYNFIGAIIGIDPLENISTLSANIN